MGRSGSQSKQAWPVLCIECIQLATQPLHPPTALNRSDAFSFGELGGAGAGPLRSASASLLHALLPPESHQFYNRGWAGRKAAGAWRLQGLTQKGLQLIFSAMEAASLLPPCSPACVRSSRGRPSARSPLPALCPATPPASCQARRVPGGAAAAAPARARGERRVCGAQPSQVSRRGHKMAPAQKRFFCGQPAGQQVSVTVRRCWALLLMPPPPLQLARLQAHGRPTAAPPLLPLLRAAAPPPTGALFPAVRCRRRALPSSLPVLGARLVCCRQVSRQRSATDRAPCSHARLWTSRAQLPPDCLPLAAGATPAASMEPRPSMRRSPLR